MQLLANTNFDFLGKKAYFVGGSVLLMAVGLGSLLVKGFTYGVDFRGGTVVQVKFQGPPPLVKIRSAMQAKGLTGSTLQPYDRPETHQVLIGLSLTEAEALQRGRQAIVEALESALGSTPGKLDFNNTGAGALAERLRNGSGGKVTGEQSEQLARAMLAYRNSPPRSGLIKNFEELSSLPGVNPDIIAALKNETYLGQFAIKGASIVGPKVGRELQRQALNATLLALAGMLVYIWFRFEWIYGVAAVLAVFHDVWITVGFFSLLEKEISLTVIAALLTLVGYSMNDTIVIFDRIRENLKLMRRTEFEPLINASVNQTLSRTFLTSGLTFLSVLSLWLFGGEVLNGFSFALVVGVIVGTYSTIFIASPILIWWKAQVERRRVARVPVAAEKATNRRKVTGR